MAYIENYPTFSKITKSVLGSLKQRAVHSYKIVGVATSLLVASSASFGLGLGVLDVQSNLDQPLNGLITVNVAPGDDLNTLTAEIASREEFERLGIDYPEYLKDIRLIVERQGQGAVLRVSSDNVVIKEPFIHFLVKVSWSGGNFLREYTALIDPPIYAAETPRSISQPKAVGTDETYNTASDEPSDDATAYEEPAPIDVETVNEPSIDSTFDDSEPDQDFDQSSADARYGPVEAGESLSLIAQELQRQVPDLSIYAIMQIMFEDNPDAFIGNNINGLIQGAILDIRDINQIRTADLVEARRFFQAQVEEWDPSILYASDSDSGFGVGQDTYQSGADSFDSGSSSLGSDSNIDSFQVGASTDTDTFVSAAQGDNSDGEVFALRQEITQLQSSLASSELENQELNERIAILEGQLADMNRLISLNVEDPELANLESTLAQQNQSDELAESNDIAGAAEDAISEFLDDSADSVSTTSTDDLLSEFLDDTDENGQGDIGNLDQDITGVDDSVDELGGAEDLAIGNIDEAQSVLEEVVEETPEPVSAPAVNRPAKSTSLLDKVGGIMPVLGGVGALLLAGLGLFFFRRRRADEEFEISMLSIESNSQSVDLDTESGMSASMSASVAASTVSEDQDTDEATADKETSFLTVYSDSDAVVQADEVDPIAEADVYIAYGRDEQAEEVLLDGIVANPDRVDVKKKLIGLYFKNKNTEGFERIAEELYAQRESMSGDDWQEISNMGNELVPENPLFALSGIDFDVVEQASENLEDKADIDLASEPVADVDQAQDDEVLAFDQVEEAVDADLLSTENEAPAAEDLSEMIVDSLDEDASIQLINFDDGRSEISELDEVEIDALAVEEGDDGVLEFNVSAPDVIDTENDSIDIDLSDTVEDLDNLNEDDLVLNFDAPGAPDEEADVGEERNFSEVPEVSDLVIDPEYDEAQTQYELAKVFVDLGDDDGARKILEDLIANPDNSDEIIGNSKELLESINS